VNEGNQVDSVGFWVRGEFYWLTTAVESCGRPVGRVANSSAWPGRHQPNAQDDAPTSTNYAVVDTPVYPILSPAG
jgi:hypothetical protein